MGKIIAVTGTTGVGKTSFVKALSKESGFKVCLEQHSERPFQSLFKHDSRYAFANQIDYLLLRAEQEFVARQSEFIGLIDGGLDQDFQGFTRLFYARGFLLETEFELCNRLYEFCRSQLPIPDLIIHLQASNQVIQERLAGRDRINIADENDITLLENFLELWLSTIPPENIIRLDVSNFSPSYSEFIPEFYKRIINLWKLDAGNYDIDYIP